MCLDTHNCLCVLFELLVIVVSVCLLQQVRQETLDDIMHL